MSALLEHALGYAGRGWPVFPLHTPRAQGCSCGEPTCSSIGKHPRTTNGLKDATCDRGRITAWWSRWPDANIGMRTGIVADVLDIDADDPIEATASWPLIEMPGGPVVRTPRGWHFHVVATGQGNRAHLAGSPCDWRGRGGYVILPPSLHASGRRYEWYSPPDLPLQPAPAALRALLAPPAAPPLQAAPRVHSTAQRPGAWNPTGIIGRVALATPGERNDRLHWAAWRIGWDERDRKVDTPTARAALDDLHRVAAMVGLGDKEIHATIESGHGAGLAGKKRGA